VRADTSRTGAAGAFHTAAQLAQRGWDASLTLGNAPRTDIVAQHGAGQRLVAIQCKASNGGSGFSLSAGCEATSAPGRDEWFVLITLWDADRRPDFYVVPRNIVAAYIFVGHRAWLTGTSKAGAPHKDSTRRDVERGAVSLYQERWDLLDGSAANVPYWLPDWVFEWAPRTGLPPGHPGLRKPDDGIVRPAAGGWAAALGPP
jgi:hypothetical protein